MAYYTFEQITMNLEVKMKYSIQQTLIDRSAALWQETSLALEIPSWIRLISWFQKDDSVLVEYLVITALHNGGVIWLENLSHR